MPKWTWARKNPHEFLNGFNMWKKWLQYHGVNNTRNIREINDIVTKIMHEIFVK